jgi:hypothetical protein
MLLLFFFYKRLLPRYRSYQHEISPVLENVIFVTTDFTKRTVPKKKSCKALGGSIANYCFRISNSISHLVKFNVRIVSEGKMFTSGLAT